MSNRYVIDDINEAISVRAFPTITMWNRLEGRPRKDDFDRALKAEIRDPLWMLTKQWQMGEFLGDDAGSPIFAKLHVATTRLNKYQAADHPVQAFDNQAPLEGIVEQRMLPLRLDERDFSVDLRLMMGRYWVRLLKKQVGDFTTFYRQNYGFSTPVDNSDPQDAPIVAHPEAWQKYAAIAGRAVDGYALYEHIDNGGNAADGLGSPQDADINLLGNDFKAWVESFFLLPDQPEENAWDPSRLEYRFSCSAPSQGMEKVYEAEEYYTGKLDWFNLSINDQKQSLGEPADGVDPNVEGSETLTFIPVALDFEGMPHTRWWTFEDRKTYLGNIKPDTTDIAKLLLLEFATVYANDWFLIPQPLPAGSISQVKGMVVTNVFGERIWVEATGTGQDDDWQRWTMYSINRKGRGLQVADNSLLLLPTVPKIQEGKPIEQFAMLRDEVANMVWAIETDISLSSGDKKKGAEAGRELYDFYQNRVGVAPDPIPAVADIRYRLVNSVPENWIPFIPVQKKGDNREIQVQRASMPRIIPGDTEAIRKVRPRTTLLREGLDKPIRDAYFIHEEEIPRSGIEVSMSYQRTRWYGGKVFNWLGVHKRTGRGEGNSGLAFDQIEAT